MVQEPILLPAAAGRAFGAVLDRAKLSFVTTRAVVIGFQCRNTRHHRRKAALPSMRDRLAASQSKLRPRDRVIPSFLSAAVTAANIEMILILRGRSQCSACDPVKRSYFVKKLRLAFVLLATIGSAMSTAQAGSGPVHGVGSSRNPRSPTTRVNPFRHPSHPLIIHKGHPCTPTPGARPCP